MTALIRMRLLTFLRTGWAMAPILTGLVVLCVLYGGGRAQPAEAYGVSAVVLFPVIAWQTRVLLDAESDVQRRLALLTVGRRRAEWLAGLLAAAAAALGTVLVALLLPWLVGGVTGPREPGDHMVVTGVTLGLWAHLLAVPAAVALGALSSRAATGSRAYGLALLTLGAVGVLVLGRADSALPWVVPPVMATARVLSDGADPALRLLPLTLWAVLWSGLVLAAYVRRRRRYG